MPHSSNYQLPSTTQHHAGAMLCLGYESNPSPRFTPLSLLHHTSLRSKTGRPSVSRHSVSQVPASSSDSDSSCKAHELITCALQSASGEAWRDGYECSGAVSSQPYLGFPSVPYRQQTSRHSQSSHMPRSQCNTWNTRQCTAACAQAAIVSH